jgi:hypothetical protein
MTLRSLLAAATVVTLAMPSEALAQPAASAPGPVAAPAPAATATATPTPAPEPAAPVRAVAPASEAPPPAIAEPVPVPPPRVAPAPPPSRPRVTEGNDLIAAGLGTLGAVYVVTSLAGAIIIDRSRETKTDAYTAMTTGPDKQRINYGRALTVPIAGPFIAMRFTDSAKERWGDAFVGSVQVAGLALATLGMIRKAKARRAQRFAVSGGFAQGGATLAVSGRF